MSLNIHEGAAEAAKYLRKVISCCCCVSVGACCSLVVVFVIALAYAHHVHPPEVVQDGAAPQLGVVEEDPLARLDAGDVVVHLVVQPLQQLHGAQELLEAAVRELVHALRRHLAGGEGGRARRAHEQLKLAVVRLEERRDVVPDLPKVRRLLGALVAQDSRAARLLE
jgi:hypothetical protein